VKIMMNHRTVAVLIEDLPNGARWATFPMTVDGTETGYQLTTDGIPDGFYPEGTFEDREDWHDVPESGGDPLEMCVRELVRVKLAHRAELLLTRT
jgi:hypothetical protein